MVPAPEHRIGPHPIFSTTAVDLFGPLEFKDMVKKRVTGKVWVVFYLCILHHQLFIAALRSHTVQIHSYSLSEESSALMACQNDHFGYGLAATSSCQAGEKLEYPGHSGMGHQREDRVEVCPL
jgi:hypothetical protein